MIDVNSLIILHFIKFFNQINNYKYIYLRERQQNPRKKSFCHVQCMHQHVRKVATLKKQVQLLSSSNNNLSWCCLNCLGGGFILRQCMVTI
jgi:hypothetical protein